jgi:hypothetical protein
MKRLFVVLLLICGCSTPAILKTDSSYESVDYHDFIDNIEDYKGKSVTLLMVYNESLPLRDYCKKFETANFHVYGTGQIVNLSINSPVLNIFSGEITVITFECRKGAFDKGNEFISMKRKR